MDARDNYRLLFSSIIIASFFAYIPSRGQFIQWLTQSAENILLIALSVSAFFSFLYLLLTATSLKYEDKDLLALVRVDKKQATLFYDLSIDTFMFAALALISGKFISLVPVETFKDYTPLIYVLCFVGTILLIRYGWNPVFRVLRFITRPKEKGQPYYDNEVLIIIVLAVGLLTVTTMPHIVRIALLLIFTCFLIVSLIRIVRNSKR